MHVKTQLIKNFKKKMRYSFFIGYKVLKIFKLKFASIFSKIVNSFLFYVNDIEVKSFNSNGIAFFNKSREAFVEIGANFIMNNGYKYSDSGICARCKFDVRDKAILKIGNNVGMSNVSITCHEKILINDNVLIGVNTALRDTDNHSLNPEDRLNHKLDWSNKKTSPIIINKDVFIGSNCLILKGVTIGEKAIIGAGSVVSKDIPMNEIWAGNPAKMIKKIK